MDLYFFRHGIAQEMSQAIHSDSHRRLTDEGRKKMHRAAKGIRALELDFDLILTSPYLRAKETAEITADVLGLEKKMLMTPTLAANGNPKELIDEVRHQHHKKRSILLVGHEPYMSRLISLLISGETSIEITLKKGGLCKLMTGSLSYGRCATFEWLLTPAQLRAIK